jgi:hypothetical protein
MKKANFSKEWQVKPLADIDGWRGDPLNMQAEQESPFFHRDHGYFFRR